MKIKLANDLMLAFKILTIGIISQFIVIYLGWILV